MRPIIDRFSGGSASSTRIDKGGATSSSGRHSAFTPSRRVDQGGHDHQERRPSM